MLDYYNLLRVAPDASAEAIRAAFRREAKRYHPDANAHLSAEERAARQRHFIVLAQAYDTLSDRARRADYDRRRLGAHQGAAKARHAGSGGGARQEAPRAAQGGAAKGGAASGSGHRSAGAGQTGNIPDWGDLLRDVEGLLQGFGLNLKQPFEDLLESLLAWALALYREVIGGPAKERPGGAARPREHGPGPKAKPRPAGGPAARRARRPDPDAIERELAELKRKAGRKE